MWMRRLLVCVAVVVFVFVLPQACLMASMLVRPSMTKGGGAVLLRTEGVHERKLAVMVPAHGGDLRKALKSLSAWPKACSPTTLRHVDLILYYAGSDDDDGWDYSVLPELERTGGRCFSRTSAIFGNLTAEVRARNKPHLLAPVFIHHEKTTKTGKERELSIFTNNARVFGFFVQYHPVFHPVSSALADFTLNAVADCCCRSRGLGRFVLEGFNR